MVEKSIDEIERIERSRNQNKDGMKSMKVENAVGE
jgi:hypothetical protein